jgi:hypothetical protein
MKEEKYSNTNNPSHPSWMTGQTESEYDDDIHSDSVPYTTARKKLNNCKACGGLGGSRYVGGWLTCLYCLGRD